MQGLTAVMAALLNKLNQPASQPSALSTLAGPGGGVLGGVQGARGIAVIEERRHAFATNPGEFTRMIRANAARAMSVPSGAPTATMVEFMTRWMPWGSTSKGQVFLAFGIAHVVDQLALGNWESGEATLHLLLCALEQSVYDQGRWTMAWLVTMLPEPPWHMLQGARPSEHIWPYGRLSPHEWIAASMQFVREAAQLAEVRHNGPKPAWAEGGAGQQAYQPADDAAPQTRPPRGPKPRAKPKL